MDSPPTLPTTTSSTPSLLPSTAPTTDTSSSAMDTTPDKVASTAAVETDKTISDTDKTPSADAGVVVASAGYKGKALRSWPQLPPEVIRLIATYHLLIGAANAPLPASWDVEHARHAQAHAHAQNARHAADRRYIPWHEHRVYVAARDTKEMEVLMCVCPQWGVAVEHHNFWNTAITLFDPHGGYAHLGWLSAHSTAPTANNNKSTSMSGSGGAAAAQRASPYTHFRALLIYSCLPCRINAPLTSHGLGSARRTFPSFAYFRLGPVGVCREHGAALSGERPERERRRDRDRGAKWCGVCLWDGELGRGARREGVRVAREEVARAEGALAQVRWVTTTHAHPGAAGLALGGMGGQGGVQALQAQALAHLEAAKTALARAQRAEEDGAPRFSSSLAAVPGTGGYPYGVGAGGYVGGDGGVVENEDESVFPGVQATCRTCRAEWLWRYALFAAGVKHPPTVSSTQEITTTRAGDSLLRALGTSTSPLDMGLFAPEDGVVRGAVNAFVELGEGTVGGVLNIAGERGWLRGQTRWAELMRQALASRRWTAGGGGEERGRATTTAQGGGKDYSGHAEVVLVTREEREREKEQNRKRRARSVSVDSIGVTTTTPHAPAPPTDTHAYANNAANNAAYARAGYTNTTTTTTPSDSYDRDYDAYDYDYDEEEEEDSELDDDEFELESDEEVAAALEMTVKDIALGDWARARILDGAWVAPADVYYGGKVVGWENPESAVSAVHPVPWNISPPSSPPHPSSASSALPAPAPSAPGAMDVAAEAPTPHPGPPAPPPPTYALAEAAHNAHMRQMRLVLLPAFRNVVRRVIVECALDAADADAEAEGDGGELDVPAHAHARRPLDPAIRAARMTLAEVVQQVREEEAVWFEGIDWSEKRRNAREQERAEIEREREHERERRHRAEGSDDSSAGTPRTSDTSPVLSTSTLGTTPSPPPLGERERGGYGHGKKHPREERARESARARQPMIAVAPVLNPPRLLRPIPHVPETIAHLPPYSLEAVRAVWREACAPLYHCRCSICERAMAAQQAAQGGSPTKAAATTTTTTAAAARAATPAPPSKEEKEKARNADKNDDAAHKDGPWVMHIPAEDEMDVGRGAESVVSLVQDGDGAFFGHADDGKDGGAMSEDEEGLTAQERYWLQVEEDEGPGAYEREMEMVAKMAKGEWGSWGKEGGMSGSDGEEYEDEELDGDDGNAFALGPAPTAWVAGTTGRKRSVDEREEGGDMDVGTHSRGGTPPKRARTGEPTVRLVKRRSEELEVLETASNGSAPKRARVEDAVGSPPDSSTPGTAASEDSVSVSA